MNVVYLSPHFPPNYYHFCRQLKTAGANVLGLGDQAYESLAAEVKDALTEYYRVPDMHDYDALVRACGFFTHKYGKIDRFDSLNEYWLSTEARIRDDFNIFGVRSGDIDFIRRKSRMKAKFQKAGVAVARGQTIQTREGARTFIHQTGYPVIAKPDSGVGALDTYRIDNDADLEAFFRIKPDVDYFMEEFVSGSIYSFDGLADRGGNLVFYTVHCFSQGIMETVNEGRHIYYYSLRKIPAQLEKLGRACVQAFEVKERFFHIEFFHIGGDDYVALEVNLRPPGGYTTDMFNYANDIDIYRAWAELLMHGRTDLRYTRRYHCCYASRKSNLRYVHTHEDIVTRYGAHIIETAVVPGVFSSALGDISYILRAENLDAIMEIVAFLHEVQT